MNNDVSLLIIGDKQNFESVERSILSFRNVYKDSDVVLVNVQHTPELNDLAEKLSINVYIPSKKYGYPMFKSTETNDLIEWCLDYPPTKEEIFHNNYIFQKQKTRNMFIDLYYKKKFKNLLIQYFS